MDKLQKVLNYLEKVDNCHCYKCYKKLDKEWDKIEELIDKSIPQEIQNRFYDLGEIFNGWGIHKWARISEINEKNKKIAEKIIDELENEGRKKGLDEDEICEYIEDNIEERFKEVFSC